MAIGLHNLSGDRKRAKFKRLGRGIGGRGAKSGRGMKGQKSRAGYSRRAGFEGGQTALYQRLPKARGAKQTFHPRPSKLATVTIDQLKKFPAGEVVGIGRLMEAGLIGRGFQQVKLIGKGQLTRPLTVRVDAVTTAARAGVESGGGKIELKGAV